MISPQPESFRASPYGAAGAFTATLRVTDTPGNADVVKKDVVVEH